MLLHTLQVLQAAVECSADPLIRFAALMHDLGKAKTPMTQWPYHPDHEKKGLAVIDSLCQRLRIPTEYRKFAELVTRIHLKIHQLSDLNAEAIVNVLEQADAFRRPQLFDDALIVCEADSRGDKKTSTYPQRTAWQCLFSECAKVKADTLIAQGLQGEAIRLGLHQHRVACVEKMLHPK